VAWEIKEALRSKIRRVIPVPIEDRWPPAGAQLPDVISELKRKQAGLPLTLQNTEERIAWLARDIEKAQEDFARDWHAPEGASSTLPGVSDQTSVPDFFAHIKRLRAGGPGQPPAPASAMATLRVFAYLRSIEVLLGLRPEAAPAGGFAALDAVAILTLAAVDRPPKEAAELAAGLRDADGGPSGLTASIIHDLAAQRTVPHVAEFVAECKRMGHADLVGETVTAFVRSESRVSLDKALLYFELLRYGCENEAKALLAETLDLEGQAAAEGEAGRGGPRPPLAGVIGEVGIVGALRYLSPTEQIVEKWIDERVDADPANWDDMAVLVARLLRNEPNGDALLARHVARRWRAAQLVQLCAILAETEGGDSPGLRLVWRYLAERQHEISSPWVFLSDVIGGYYTTHSPELKDTFEALLTAIVTGGENLAEPCPVGFLRMVADALKSSNVPAQCRVELLKTAATHPEHRPGADVAQLLVWVGDAVRRPAGGGNGRRGGRRRGSGRQGGGQEDGTRLARLLRSVARWLSELFATDLWQVALEVNRLYARDLATADPFDPTGYIEYLAALRDYPTLTFWAVRELTDPDGSAPGDPADPAAPVPAGLTGGQIGAIAVGIYAGGLHDTAFDLLERYLENEQAVERQDVEDIVAVVTRAEREDGIRMRQHRRWDVLFGATVGRWTDTEHLQEVWEKLNENPDYAREAKAIMSLSQ